MVGGVQGARDVAQERSDPGKSVDLGACWTARGRDRLMKTASGLHGGTAPRCGAQYKGGRIETE